MTSSWPTMTLEHSARMRWAPSRKPIGGCQVIGFEFDVAVDFDGTHAGTISKMI